MDNNLESKTGLTAAQQLAAHEATLIGYYVGLFPPTAATLAAVTTARAAVLARMT